MGLSSALMAGRPSRDADMFTGQNERVDDCGKLEEKTQQQQQRDFINGRINRHVYYGESVGNTENNGPGVLEAY